MAAGTNGVRRWQLVGVGAVAVVAVVLALSGDDGDDLVSGASTTTITPESTSTSSVSNSTSSSAATATTLPGGDTATAVWPAPGTGVSYDDPVAAAVGFATDFVGFVDPVAGDFRPGDSRSGEVEIRPLANGPATTVFVRQLTDGAWWVLGSVTDSIELQSPEALAEIASPIALAGRSTAFEAVVEVQLRADGEREPIATGFVMGGANGEVGPFDGTLTFRAPAAAAGALILSTSPAENGRMWEASVVRVRLGFSTGELRTSTEGASQPPAHGGNETVVTVYFSCEDDIDGGPVAVHRVVSTTRALLRASLAQGSFRR